MTTTETMNAELLAKCEEAAARFPHIDPKLIGKAMKFAMLAGMALGTCEKTLSEKGKTLSEKGIEFVLAEVAKHVDD